MSEEKMVYQGVSIPKGDGGLSLGKGYHVSPALYAFLENYSEASVSEALNYVFGRKPHYQDNYEDGLDECFAVVSFIYGRLGNENAYRFYQRPDGQYIMCANALEILTDAIIVFWNSGQVSVETKQRVQTQWTADVMLKYISLPDVDGGQGWEDVPANLEIAMMRNPLELIIINEMFEHIEVVELSDGGEGAQDMLGGVMSNMNIPNTKAALRRVSGYEQFADWERGTGFEWPTYDTPPPEMLKSISLNSDLEARLQKSPQELQAEDKSKSGGCMLLLLLPITASILAAGGMFYGILSS